MQTMAEIVNWIVGPGFDLVLRVPAPVWGLCGAAGLYVWVTRKPA